MSAHAEPVDHGHGQGHGDHAPPIHYSSRMPPAVLGMFLFIASEIMLFGSFFTVYFFDRVANHGVNGEWPPNGYERPWFVAGVNTVILMTSSVSMHWADSSIKKGNRNGLKAGMVLTFLLGLTFLVTQVIEYHRLHFNTSDTSFASTFFGLTGLHGAHVAIGLTILLAMTIRSFKGHFSPEDHRGIEIGGIYWHFVDLMWIVVYVTVYLL